VFRRFGMCLLLVGLVGVTSLPATAGAVTCGARGSGAAKAATGALTLKAGDSTVAIDAGRKTSERRLIFIFDVSKCTLAPRDAIKVKVRSSDVDRSAFGTPEVDPKGAVLLVEVPVRPKRFDPGKHSAVVTVVGPHIVTSISKVSLQRTEDRWYIPLLICLIAAVLGLAWAFYTVWAGETTANAKQRLKVRYLPVAVVGALAASWLIYKATYLDAEIWELEVATAATLFVAALTAAAGGSTVGAVTKVLGGSD
jgi:hypothetical protein